MLFGLLIKCRDRRENKVKERFSSMQSKLISNSYLFYDLVGFELHLCSGWLPRGCWKRMLKEKRREIWFCVRIIPWF